MTNFTCKVDFAGTEGWILRNPNLADIHELSEFEKNLKLSFAHNLARYLKFDINEDESKQAFLIRTVIERPTSSVYFKIEEIKIENKVYIAHANVPEPSWQSYGTKLNWKQRLKVLFKGEI